MDPRIPDHRQAAPMTWQKPQPHNQREFVSLAAERELEDSEYTGADDYHRNHAKEELGLQEPSPRAHIVENNGANADQRMHDPHKDEEDCEQGWYRQGKPPGCRFRFEIASDKIDAAKWRLSGITAIAVRRCDRDSHSSSRALPNWRIRRGIASSRSAIAFDGEVAFVIGVF
jgi:hypothetical protein